MTVWQGSSMPALSFAPLSSSLEALKIAIDALDNHGASAQNEALRAVFRAAVIKNFEVAYEVAWKTMTRWVSTTQGETALEQLRSRRDLFRLCAKLGIIADPAAWMRFHQARNESAHVYREEVAEGSLAAAREFLGVGALVLTEMRDAAD